MSMRKYKWRDTDDMRMRNINSEQTKYQIGSVVSLYNHPLTLDMLADISRHIDINLQWLIVGKRLVDAENVLITICSPMHTYQVNLWYVDTIHHLDK